MNEMQLLQHNYDLLKQDFDKLKSDYDRLFRSYFEQEANIAALKDAMTDIAGKIGLNQLEFRRELTKTEKIKFHSLLQALGEIHPKRAAEIREPKVEFQDGET